MAEVSDAHTGWRTLRRRRRHWRNAHDHSHCSQARNHCRPLRLAAGGWAVITRPR